MGSRITSNVNLADSSNRRTVNLIVCRSCHAHLARYEDIIIYIPDWVQLSNVVNVVIDGPAQHRVEGYYTFADVQCGVCEEQLGVKYIEDNTPTVLDHGPSKKGRYNLNNDKLGSWSSEFNRFTDFQLKFIDNSVRNAENMIDLMHARNME